MSEKLQERYRNLATAELIELGKGCKDMREDALPFLLAELKTRGEVELVKTIEEKLAAPNQASNQQEDSDLPLSLLASETGKMIETDDNDDILDLNFTDAKSGSLNEKGMKEIIDFVMKNRATLSNWESTSQTLIKQFGIGRDDLKHVQIKLKKKMNQNNNIVGVIGTVAGLGLLIAIVSKGEVIFFPGLLLILVAGTSIAKARHLKRILS